MTQRAILLTPPHNFGVVQLPERKHPGVVIQGDTLHSMVADLEGMQKLLGDRDLAELSDALESMREILSEVRSSYERICHENNIDLPYPQPQR
ncbi:hypothetical protein P6U16_01250 [Rhizobium sp. 32-5/1]|uniref:DUF6959 family protein n=1 Tax=Rhizobium sp. 32-5/1 TaxID=3019602 RepID=UPI00240D5CED|nr:hypothetical protein [Rhizobium sp. 32-5/1]WEZ83512.1 hypothetical protein P6U16_01250 [Rhizobium sp. 32-5/1]